MIKNPPINEGDVGDACLILWLGISSGEGMAKDSTIFAWKIPWSEEFGRL